MSREPYREVRREDLITRDLLARDRTVLANERTLLAYIRTALAVVVAAVSLIQFFDLGWARVVGWALVPVSVIIVACGVWRYLQVRRDLAPLR